MPIHTPNGTFYRNDDPADRAAIRARLDAMRPSPAVIAERRKAREEIAAREAAALEQAGLTGKLFCARDVADVLIASALADIDAAFGPRKTKKDAA